MSQSKSQAPALTPAEADLGKALVLLHRAAGRIDEPSRREETHAVLTQAVAFLDSALRALEGGASAAALGVQRAATNVEGPIVAIIAAAVAVYLDRPYRLVSVQQVSAPVVPHLNVWAVEGRTQIFMSHRVR